MTMSVYTDSWNEVWVRDPEAVKATGIGDRCWFPLGRLEDEHDRARRLWPTLSEMIDDVDPDWDDCDPEDV